MYLCPTMLILNKQKENQDVIIIGAGMAGLAAAQTFQANGLNPIILEARNRVGGRINTIYSWNMTLDLGAHWLHKIENNPLGDIVKKSNIATQFTTFCSTRPFDIFNSMRILDHDGNTLDQSRVATALIQINQFTEYLELHASSYPEDISIAVALKEFAKHNEFNNDSLALVKYISTDYGEFETGANISNISSKTVEIKPTAVGRDVIFMNGCSQLLTQFKKDTRIMFRQIVNDIVYNKKIVKIYTQDNCYEAKHVVVTLPLGVLKANVVRFNPTLPIEKVNAINKLGYGVLNKIFLRFEIPFWDLKKEWILFLPSLDKLQDTLEIHNSYVTTQQPILIVYTTGCFSRELEKLDDKQIILLIINRLKIAFGKKIPEPLSYIITRWEADPFSRGSFSYTHVGNTVDDYKILSQSIHEKLFFAGEATSWFDSSTLTGAYLSGVRAANEVLKLL